MFAGVLASWWYGTGKEEKKEMDETKRRFDMQKLQKELNPDSDSDAGIFSSSDEESEDGEMGEIKRRFKAASAFLPQATARLPQAALLRLYGLYKTAGEGRADPSDKPSFFDQRARAKWAAWEAVGEMSKREAMRRYADELEGYNVGFDPSCEPSKNKGGATGGFGKGMSRMRAPLGMFGVGSQAESAAAAAALAARPAAAAAAFPQPPREEPMPDDHDENQLPGGRQEGEDAGPSNPIAIAYRIVERARAGGEEEREKELEHWLNAAKSDDVPTVKAMFERNRALLKRRQLSTGLTALHWAADSNAIRVVEYLVSVAPEAIRELDIEGNQPLHLAAICGYTEVAVALLDAGACSNIRNYEDETAIDIASHDELREMLKQRAPASSADLSEDEEEEEEEEDADNEESEEEMMQ